MYQFANAKLCEKWNNNIPLRELQDEKYLLLTDSQNLQSLEEYFPVIPLEDITGAIVAVEDSEYSEVYLTESSAPYSLDSVYHPMDYYGEG